jgi:hypothetical protein
LVEELQNEPWLELPPAQLVRWMAAARDGLRVQRAVAELERIEIELNVAFSALDLETGRRLRERWYAELAVCAAAASRELIERAEPALAWLAAEDRKQRELAEHEAAAAALDKALDDRRPLAEFERNYHAAVRHGHTLAPQLEDRYHARVSELELASARRARLLIVGVAATAVLAGVIVAGIILGRLHARAVQTADAALDGLLDGQRLSGAQEYLAKLEETSPRVARAVEIQDAAARLQGMLKQEEDRQAALAKAIGIIRASMPDPDPQTLARARELARTHEEKVSVLELETAVAAYKQKVQGEADQRFHKALEQFLEQLAQLSKDEQADLGTQQSAIARVRSDLSSLERRSKDASDSAREQLKAVWLRVSALEKAVDRRKQEETSQRAITQAVGNLARYREELGQYVRECPESTRAADFKRALDEAPLWEGIEKWNEVVRRWQEMHLREPDSETASGILMLVKSLLKEHGNSSDAEAFRTRIPYLEALGRRLEAGRPIHARLRQLFTDPLVAKVWMIEEKNGRRYYLANDPAVSPEQIGSFKHIVSFDFKERGGPVTRGDVTYSGPAPQVGIAKAVNATLAKMNAENWEASICTIVSAIYTDGPEQALEPLLKATLLYKTLELGCQGSPSLQRAYGPHLEVLGKVNSGRSSNWLDPRDVTAKNARLQVEADLANLPDIVAAAKLAAEDAAALRACPGRFYRWVGWLHRSHQGGWSCSAISGLKYSGRLCVVRRATPSDSVRIEVVGRMEEGVVTVTTSDSDIMIEGRPVYLDVSESGTKS